MFPNVYVCSNFLLGVGSQSLGGDLKSVRFLELTPGSELRYLSSCSLLTVWDAGDPI